MPPPSSPFPALKVHPTSGLSFPWAELHPDKVTGSFDASLGKDGVNVGLLMIINWTDLQTALQQILGYSSRQTDQAKPRISRKLPWQHPYLSRAAI